MKIKPGVKLCGLKPEILLGHLVVARAFREMGRECVITEVTGGVHGRASLHYQGQAIDYRTRHLSGQEKTTLLNQILVRLNGEFDVVMHPDHLHVEWQPKAS